MRLINEKKINCIFCDLVANSREHIFPASFGGRITNSKIYCEKHNNELGNYVAHLEKQFSIFNSMLEIIADRKKTTKSTIFKDEDGVLYKITFNNIQIPPPPLLTEEDVNKTQKLQFASQSDAKKWLEDNKARHFCFDNSVNDILQTLEMRRYYSINPIRTSLSFGDLYALKAILYLTITLLTHKKPEIIRSSNIDKIKSLLLNKNEDDKFMVSWNGHDILNYVHLPTSMFSHIFRFILTKKWGCYAQVSLFSTFNFFVDLGQLMIENDEELIFYIDPLCKTHEQLSFFCSNKEFIEDDIDHIKNIIPLKEMISNKHMEKLLNRFMCKIEKHQNKLLAEKLLRALRDTNTPEKIIDEFIMDYSQGYLYEIINLNKSFNSINLKKLLQKIYEHNKILTTDRINVICEKFYEKIKIKEDNSQPHGLDINSQKILDRLLKFISNSLNKLFTEDSLDKDKIESYLNKSALKVFFKKHYTLALIESYRDVLLPLKSSFVSSCSQKSIKEFSPHPMINDHLNKFDQIFEKKYDDFMKFEEEKIIPIIIDNRIEKVFDVKHSEE